MKRRGRFAGRTFVIMAGDALVAIGTFSLVVLARRALVLPGTTGRLPAANVPLEPFPWLAAVAGSALLALWLAATYDEPAVSIKERGGLLVSSLLTAAFLVAFFFLAGRAVPRTVLVIFVAFFTLGLVAWRSAMESMLPIGWRKVLVLGGGEDARRAAEALQSGNLTGHTLLEWRRELSFSEANWPAAADDVVFASERPEDRTALVALLARSLEHEFDLWILPGLADVVSSRVVTSSLGDLPVAQVVTRGASPVAFAWRRALDLILGTALLVLALPILLVTTVLVVLESRGEPWLRQRRIGRGGNEFTLWKIRTMRANAEEETGPTLAEKDDERITRVGRLLRRLRLDELPQLLHVVGGTMSLIGPRPERPEFVAAFEKQVPAYRLRHVLKPGLTGLAQVMGVYATKPDVKLRYDLGYLFHWNPFLDLFILARTFGVVLKGSGT